MKKTLNRLVVAVTLLFAGGGSSSLALGDTERPNLVVIVIDALRADKLGAYGGSPLVSPELDAYARRGVVFDAMIAQASWTRSSVASLVTGRYPREVGVLKEKWDVLPAVEQLVSERLKDVGYATVGVTANPQLNSVFGFNQGFDQYRDSTAVFGWMKKRPGQTVLAGKNPVRAADDLFAEALELVKGAGSTPVYLQALIMEVHAHHRIPQSEVDEDLLGLKDAPYLQAVRNASRSIGRFIDAYERAVSRPTVFVITSDHGEGLQDHPGVKSSQGHGNLLYTSHIRVPCIVFGPPTHVKGGHRVTALTRLLDLSPTLAELGQAPAPAGAAGRSLAPALLGGGLPGDHPKVAFSETRWRKVDKVAVTDGEWLYVENRDGWPGTEGSELHPFGGPQDGRVTNQLEGQRAVAVELATHLDVVETALTGPAAGAAQAPDSGVRVPEEAISQLESLGYLQ